MFKLDQVQISGKSVLPIIEGGKGIGVSNGTTAGHFAKNGAVGTFSGVNADSYDDQGNYIPQTYSNNLTRKEKFAKLLEYSINGAITQAQIAHDISGGNGRIHMNVLWEAGGAKKVIEEVLIKAKGLIHGVTCGAGLPYDLAEVASKYKVYYYPIVSSARAFNVLWRRAYNKLHEFLGGVVYEDPWVAGGHTGLSNKEDPFVLEDPYQRVAMLRSQMDAVGLQNVPIIMAGGVWALKEWNNYIDNKEIGKIAFQFGTRPLLTKESPISLAWKKLLTTLAPDNILLHKFSPTGLYSIAIKNKFLQDLIKRSSRQIDIAKEVTAEFTKALFNKRGNTIGYVKESDFEKASSWQLEGFDTILRTPDNTVIFVEHEKAKEIKNDQANCMGCLSHCMFSNWKDKEPNNTGLIPDPRSFCIQKTLQDVIHGGAIEQNLLFSGKNGYRFATDSLYQNGFIPTIKQLIEKICAGE
ncbi:NAD(P)H-dependent flavin oxidoreductase [Rickettsiales bacterium LUAb2]